MKISELFDKQGTVLSFEVFPPKPNADEAVIYEALDGLSGLHPDFISVTYGAGGGKNGGKTIKIAADVKHKYGIEAVAHLPCIGIDEEETVKILEDLKEKGIENILALRGDISADTVINGRFSHANELIEFIKERYDFNIIAACYPEGHSENKSIAEDIHNLKRKTDSGASHLITQLFLDNRYFYEFRERTAIAGINVPVSAGIMPVTNKAQIERMVKLCGISLPKKFMKIIERYENDPVALRDAGIAYAIDQLVDLISYGADGIHLYTMNNHNTAKRIYEAVHRLLKCT